MWGNVNIGRHFPKFWLCRDNATNAGGPGHGVTIGVGSCSRIVWLMIFILLHFFSFSSPGFTLFPCQVAPLVIELQPLVAVLQRGSKCSGDQPCCILEHATPVLPVSFHLEIVGLYGVHSNKILCQSIINVLSIILFNSY